jgi:hypothetical protein
VIVEYAQANQWDKRVAQLQREFDSVLASAAAPNQAASVKP